MIRTLALALALLSGAALASGTPAQDPGGPPVFTPPPPVVTQMLFDCPSGPGYLRVLWVSPYGQKGGRTIFAGSREECLVQAKVLRDHRSVIAKPSLVAACTGGNATYLVRFAINQWGQVVSLPHLYYDDAQECLKDATELNTKN